VRSQRQYPHVFQKLRGSGFQTTRGEVSDFSKEFDRGRKLELAREETQANDSQIVPAHSMSGQVKELDAERRERKQVMDLRNHQKRLATKLRGEGECGVGQKTG